MRAKSTYMIEVEMKKYRVIGLALAGYLTLAKSALLAGTNSQSEQALVEQGLRLPVLFEQAQEQTFNVGERLAHYKVPGISFALIDNGQIAWAKGYGATSVSSNQPVTAETVFQAASIAKPVTAYGVMRMQDKGKLDIRADIQQYLTSVALPASDGAAGSDVTFKNLLDHTSGLSGGGYGGYQQGQDIPSDIQTFRGDTPANTTPAQMASAPGETVRYSGAGYTLVEIALHDMFKHPFEKVMNEWVLSRLGMQHSAFDLDYPAKQGIQVALGHDSSGETISGGWRVHPEQAAAGLWSTPTDLARFAIEMSRAYSGNSRLLSQAAAREMLAPVMPGQDLSGDFGGQPAMTFVVSGPGKPFWFNHGGGTAGYRCLMVMYPETGDGAVFMTNSNMGFGVGLEMMRAASAVYNWPDYKVKTFKTRAVDPAVQKGFLGEYVFDAGWQVEIIEVAQADGIAVKFPNGDIYPLNGIKGAHAYIHQETGVKVRFEWVDNNPQIHLYNQTAQKKPSSRP